VGVLRRLCTDNERVLLGGQPVVDVLGRGQDKSKAGCLAGDFFRSVDGFPPAFEAATGRIVVDLRSNRQQDICLYVEYKDGRLQRLPLYPEAGPDDVVRPKVHARNEVRCQPASSVPRWRCTLSDVGTGGRDVYTCSDLGLTSCGLPSLPAGRVGVCQAGRGPAVLGVDGAARG
jgi:hypothetical protein